MTNDPAPNRSANTEDLAVTEYDAHRHPDPTKTKGADTEAVPPMNDEVPEVGMSQKGDGEDAVVKRETEI